MTQPLAVPPPPPVHIGLRIASTLCWVWGVLLALMSVSLGIPAISLHGAGSGAALVALAFLLLAASYCFAGYALRKARPVGAWIAVIAACVFSLMQILVGVRSVSFGLVVSLTIVALVAFNWRHLEQRP